MKKNRLLLAMVSLLISLSAPSEAQATAIVATVERIEVTSTAKGHIGSVFDGGQWQGARIPKPSTAQRLSDRIRIEFAADGVPIKSVTIDACDARPLQSTISVAVVLSDLATTEKLKPYECKISQCFLLSLEKAKVRRVVIDFLNNPEPCVKGIRFHSPSPKVPIVVKVRNPSP